jgi:hypothetical protein
MLPHENLGSDLRYRYIVKWCYIFMETSTAIKKSIPKIKNNKKFYIWYLEFNCLEWGVGMFF